MKKQIVAFRNFAKAPKAKKGNSRKLDEFLTTISLPKNKDLICNMFISKLNSYAHIFTILIFIFL